MRWRADDRACPLCGSSRVRRLGARGGRAHHAAAGVETTVVRCRDCHGVYQRPTMLPLGNPYDEHAAEDYFRLHDEMAKIANGECIAADAEALLARAGQRTSLPVVAGTG